AVATVAEVKPVLDLDFDKTAPAVPASDIIPVSATTTKKPSATPIPTPPVQPDEEWLMASQPAPNDEIHSLLDL
ncbi:TPA: MFS transporter, partial [Enterobacter kobei]|nr:MFS transporter [Enterobacter kobei]